MAEFIYEVLVTEDMVGHRLGEFSPTKKFMRHGGKMQKEIELKAKEAEVALSRQSAARRQHEEIIFSHSMIIIQFIIT